MKHLIAAVALCLTLGGGASASPLDDVVSIEVLPGWDTPGGTHVAALRLRLAPGWKTYWRTPGEAGIPPLFDWAGSENIASATIRWPAPEVFDQNGLRSVGYSEQLVLPVELTPTRPGAAMRLAGEVDIGVCHDVCLPARLSFAADLPQPGVRDGAIVAALVDRPLTAAEAGVTSVSCHLSPTGAGIRVAAEVSMPVLGPGEALVIEAGDPAIWVSEPTLRREGGRVLAEAEARATGAAPLTLDRSRMVLTLLAGGRAVEIVGCPAPRS